MSLFVCDECGVIENTALSRFWMHYGLLGGRALCSLCDPEIGKWHGHFDRRPYEPERDTGVAYLGGKWTSQGGGA